MQPSGFWPGASVLGFCPHTDLLHTRVVAVVVEIPDHISDISSTAFGCSLTILFHWDNSQAERTRVSIPERVVPIA